MSMSWETQKDMVCLEFPFFDSTFTISTGSTLSKGVKARHNRSSCCCVVILAFITEGLCMKSNAEWSDRSSLSAMVTVKSLRLLAFLNGSSNNIYQIEDLGKTSGGYDACYMASRSANPAGGHAYIPSTQNCIVHTLYSTLSSILGSCSAK